MRSLMMLHVHLQSYFIPRIETNLWPYQISLKSLAKVTSDVALVRKEVSLENRKKRGKREDMMRNGTGGEAGSFR